MAHPDDPALPRDEHGWSALDRAAASGDTDTVRALLDAGADPRAAGPDGRTGYDIALAAGRLDTARLLRAAAEAADPAGSPGHDWRPYCRAYPLARLREFAGWPALDQAPEIAYLHDDLTVTAGVWPGEDVLFDQASPEWARFCADTLGFAVPDDLDLAIQG